MKWFFFASFIAALFCSIFWTGVIIYAIAASRFVAMGFRGILILVPLPFLGSARDVAIF